MASEVTVPHSTAGRYQLCKNGEVVSILAPTGGPNTYDRLERLLVVEHQYQSLGRSDGYTNGDSKAGRFA